MQLSVTITSLGSAISIQDPHPTNGIFSKTIPAGSAKTFDCPWEVWHRISSIVEAHRAAGRCTVALREVTPTGTDGTSGANTTYNRADWALLNSFRHDIADLQTTVGSLTGPFAYQGSIAVNTDFPLLADVATGWVFTLTADTTDDAGVTYTNTGLTFLSGSEIVWNGSTWIKLGDTLTNPLQYKGTVTNAASFPAPTGSTGVKSGHCYLVTAAVVDNDATKTNTNQIFTNGDTIQWNGTSWNILAPQYAFNFRGTVTVATDFPLVALVKTGHVYRCLAGVTDNGGATYTNTGQVFLTGDMIVWYSGAWYVIQKAPSVAVPAAIGVAAAGTSPRPSNDDHVHAHGNQSGGTEHAVVVAGVSNGFMTSTMATTLARVNDYTMAVKVVGVDAMVDESEVSAQLTGDFGKKWVPTHLVIKVATVTGIPGTPAAINVGTTAGGVDIASNVALTGLVLVGDTRMLPIAGGTWNIAGNATIYVNVESAEAVATVLTCDVFVHGVLTD